MPAGASDRPDCAAPTLLLPVGLDHALAKGPITPYAAAMQTLSISKAKDRLNELVEAAAVTREQVTITKNGAPAAVLIGADEWESIQETLYWLAQPRIRESLAAGEAEAAAGQVFDEAAIRSEFGVATRDS